MLEGFVSHGILLLTIMVHLPVAMECANQVWVKTVALVLKIALVDTTGAPQNVGMEFVKMVKIAKLVLMIAPVASTLQERT